MVVEAAGGVTGVARAEGGVEQHQRGRQQAEPGQVGERSGGVWVGEAAQAGDCEGGDQEAEREGEAGEQAGGLGEALTSRDGAHQAVHGVQAGEVGLAHETCPRGQLAALLRVMLEVRVPAGWPATVKADQAWLARASRVAGSRTWAANRSWSPRRWRMKAPGMTFSR